MLASLFLKTDQSDEATQPLGKPASAVVATTSPLISEVRQVRWILLRIKLHIWSMALMRGLNPFRAYQKLKTHLALVHTNGTPIHKLVKRGSSYQTALQQPAWPSAAFDAFVVEQLSRPNGAGAADPLRAATLSLTHRCSPECNPPQLSLSTQELSLETLRKRVERLQHEGVRQLTISGGEPMLRYPELLELLQTAKAGTDFWLNTSGWGLSPEKARELKEAGLLGIVLNLDHNDPEKHNTLRANRHSFGWVMRAAESARKANLLLCFTLCATPEFVSKESLLAYGRLAKNLGASFIQIQEPLAAAADQPKGLILSTMQISLLERFTISINQDSAYSSWPLISYQGGRHKQPASDAQRLLRIDGSANISSCSYCQPKPVAVTRDRSSLAAPKPQHKSRLRSGSTTSH